MNIREKLGPDLNQVKWSRIRFHQATMHNSVFNPFETITDEIQYMKVVSTVPEFYHEGFHYEHNFQVDPRMQ